eukprot:m.429358 g.429358  ORF g.429358 m.429358 type:complete len:584 (-) comp21387_c0_seq1:2724-4475(-)
MSWMRSQPLSADDAALERKPRRANSANPFASLSKSTPYPTRASNFLHGLSAAKEIRDSPVSEANRTSGNSASRVDTYKNSAPEETRSHASTPEIPSRPRDSRLLGMLSGSATTALKTERVSKRRRKDPKSSLGAYSKNRWSKHLDDDNFDLEEHFNANDFGTTVSFSPVDQHDGNSPPTAAEARADVTDGLHVNIPLDWSLKSGIRLTSKYSFDWVKRIGSGQAASGLAGYLREAPQESLSDAERIQHARMYFTHPCGGWSEAFSTAAQRIATFSGGKEPAAQASKDETILRSIHADWATAFESVYRSLQHNHCPYFYVSCQQFTVLFRAAHIGGFSEISAIVTTSTRGLRNTLSSEAIPFEMPLAPEYFDAEKQREKTRGELASFQRETGVQTNLASTSGTSIDGTDKAMLYFHGHEGVHGIFELILNHKYARANAYLAQPPPTLYSPTAFVNSTLKAMSITYCGKVSRSSSRSNRRTTTTEVTYALDLEGPCMPLSFFSLCNAVDQAHSQDYEVLITNSQNNTGMLNWTTESMHVDVATPVSDHNFIRRKSELRCCSLRKVTRRPQGWKWSTKLGKNTIVS